MSEQSEADAVLIELTDSLVGQFGLERLDQLDDEGLKNRSGTSRAILLHNPKVRIDQRFDPRADAMIIDTRLATLGLIHVVSEPRELATAVKGFVDQATYVRHLCIAECSRSGEDSFPWTVELVLVLANDDETRRELGYVLRQIARDTSFLHAVGINVLPFRQGRPRFDESDLRRAFAWLLAATDRWYQGHRADFATHDSAKMKRLGSVTLTDYRLPGIRTFDFDESAVVHLLHGHNGTGKSSLVESIELTVTGQVERLRTLEPSDYPQVIKSARALDPNSPAKVSLHDVTKQVIWERPIDASTHQPMSRDIKATAFRLDHSLMQRLTEADDVQRAGIFLESYFPKDANIYGAFRTARLKARDSFYELPLGLQQLLLDSTSRPQQQRDSAAEADATVSAAQTKAEQSFTSEVEKNVLARFGWLTDPMLAFSPENAAHCLPLTIDAIKNLATFDKALAHVSAWSESSPPSTADVQQTLAALDQSSVTWMKLAETGKALSAARSTLERLRDWHVTKKESSSDALQETLAEWIRVMCLSDIAEKFYKSARVLHEFRGADLHDTLVKTPLIDLYRAVQDPQSVEQARKLLADWSEQRDSKYDKLSKQYEAPSSTSGQKTSSTEFVLSRGEIEILNSAEAWLFPHRRDEESDPLPLGQAINSALRKNRHLRVGDVEIGQPGWTQSLLSRLEKLQELGRQLEMIGRLGPGQSIDSRSQLFTRSLKMLEDIQTSRRQGELVEQTFFSKFNSNSEDSEESSRELNDALNELMALFTPARWAYEEIAVTHKSDLEWNQKLSIRIGKNVHAHLRLNTAELNVFTLALFLLCARQADNPLGLLILDDPLQNMDELTVTTLARGMSKVTRRWLADEKWNRNWQIWMLFHARDDLERFRREIPAAVYFLKWLSPSNHELDHNVSKSKEFPGLPNQPRDICHVLSLL